MCTSNNLTEALQYIEDELKSNYKNSKGYDKDNQRKGEAPQIEKNGG